jgi:hypothetical protein
MNSGPITFQWQDNPAGNYGPGISRPLVPERAKPFVLQVRHGKARPIKVTLMAEDQDRAIQYAGNRWPGAQVEVA